MVVEVPVVVNQKDHKNCRIQLLVVIFLKLKQNQKK